MAVTIAHNRAPRRRLHRLPLYLIALVLAAAFLLPLLWAFSASLKTITDIYTFPPRWLPRPFHPENWVEVWSIVPLARYLGNTLLVVVLSLVGQLLSCSLVAYGFARFRFPLRRTLFGLVLAVLILPPIVYLLPQYLIFNRLGWIDTYLPLVVPWWLAAGPGGAFSIFLLRQFYTSIPLEIDQAAKLDGASYLQIWWRIMLPLSRPSLGAIAVFGFIWHWNDFLEPLIYLQSQDKFTISLGLRFLQTSAAAGANSAPLDNLLMTASLIACIPPLILFVVAQKKAIQGINLSGGKD